MFVIPAVVMLSTAGVAFYARFLYALCKEYRPRRIRRRGSRFRLEKRLTIQPLPPGDHHSRAASQVVEIPLNRNLPELRRKSV